MWQVRKWIRESELFFFFNDTATTEIYTLSLHDALPISSALCSYATHRSERRREWSRRGVYWAPASGIRSRARRDRKSTRLNSSHANISYAVFCLKKKTLLSSFIISLLSSPLFDLLYLYL